MTSCESFCCTKDTYCQAVLQICEVKISKGGTQTKSRSADGSCGASQVSPCEIDHGISQAFSCTKGSPELVGKLVPRLYC
jgi:hypothetical protein